MRKCLPLVCLFIGIVAIADRPRAQGPQAVFHSIGDLPGGGAMTIIRDATRVGGEIYAVGGAVSRLSCPAGLCPFTDTAILWRSGTGTTQVLPDLVANTAQTTVFASAITPGGAYIASTARGFSPTPPTLMLRSVRVTTSSLTNLDLSAFAPPVTISSGAVAISTDGSVLYGRRSGVGIRFDTATNTNVVLPFVLPSHNFNPVVDRGTSANGSVAVGASFNSATPDNRRAYRYVHGSPTPLETLPLLPGGTVNNALAVSPDGDLVLLTGNSASRPNGEAYLYRASTQALTPLGSPNPVWVPGARACGVDVCQPSAVPAGGMTADGSVVAMNFARAGNQGGDDYAYFRNAHGWFHLTSALAANGVDLEADGWTAQSLAIQGMSPDGTLVFGFGERNGTNQGFVAEFAPGVLAAFNPQATPPVDTSFVGVWTLDPVGEETHFLVFTADGVYYQIEDEDAGFERGLYTFDGTAATITTLRDTNGSAGLSDDNGKRLMLPPIVGDTAGPLRRIAGSPGSIVSGWVRGDPTQAGNSVVTVFTPTTYGVAQDLGTASDGSATGTYSWNPATHVLDLFPTGGPPDPGNVVSLSADGLRLFVVDEGGNTLTFSRVIDPATIPSITSPLSVSGTVGQPFNYTIVSANAQTYSAAGLPPNLSINPATGAITGTPTAGGEFLVAIAVTSAVGVSDAETLRLTIAIPTAVGQNVVVTPQVPDGPAQLTISFNQVTTQGATTVNVVDPEQASLPAPPANFMLGDPPLVYEIASTAGFSGPVTLCLNYAGVDFGTGTPRLFHFEGGQWVDITITVDLAAQTLCGRASSLSPFAIMVSTEPSAQNQLDAVGGELAQILADHPGTPLADKIEDVYAKLATGSAKLLMNDPAGALGELEGAVGDLEAAVRARLLTTAAGHELMRQITNVGRVLAEFEIANAVARGGSAGKIAEARRALAAGNTQRTNTRFKSAAASYTKAVSLAKGA